jgi:hypothetical protein
MHGELARTVALPAPIDPDQAKAKFKDGLLVLTLPKSCDKQWLGTAFRQESGARNASRLAGTPPTGSAGFQPARGRPGSMPGRRRPGWSKGAFAGGRPAVHQGRSVCTSAAGRAPGTLSPRRAKPAESRRSQSDQADFVGILQL